MTVTEYSRWLGERDHLFKPVAPVKQTGRTTQYHGDLLAHASAIISETTDCVWLRPDPEQPELPDRTPVGVYQDPTGDTVVNDKRLRLADAVRRLVCDRYRAARWRQLVQDTNTACQTHGIDPVRYRIERHSTTPLGRWLFDRNIMLEYCAHAPHRVQVLAEVDARAVARLADVFARSNKHFEQRVGNAATQLGYYHGDTTQ